MNELIHFILTDVLRIILIVMIIRLVLIKIDDITETNKEIVNKLEEIRNEAIPIDFLIKTQEEYCKRYGEVYKAVVLNLIEDWEKENG